MKDNCFPEFCFQTSTWIDHRYIYIYIYIPSLLNLPPISCPIPPLWNDTEPLFEFPELHSKFPLAIYFTYGDASFHVTLSVHLNLSSPLPMSLSLISMSVSPLLPCKWILEYYFSRFCIYTLEYGIYLSLSDSLHSV